MKYRDIPVLVNYQTRIETKVNVDGKTYYRPIIDIPMYEEQKGIWGTYWVKLVTTKKGSLWIEEPYRWIRYSNYTSDKWYETEAECIKMIKSFQIHNYTIEPFKQYLHSEDW
jgi:hypothetical protein